MFLAIEFFVPIKWFLPRMFLVYIIHLTNAQFLFCNRHDEIFDGVILAYEVNIPSEPAKIISGLIPYLGVKMKASLLLFAPKPSMLLGVLSLVVDNAILAIYHVFLLWVFFSSEGYSFKRINCVTFRRCPNI